MCAKYVFYIDSMQKGGANRVMANLTEYFACSNYDVVLINDIRPQEGIPEYEVHSFVKRYFLDIKCSSRGLSNIKRIFALRKTIKKEKPDVVISFMGPPNIRMLLATLGMPCKKVVSVRNDPNVEYGTRRVTKLIKRTIFRLADGCVFQTQDAAKYFPIAVRKKARIIFNPVNSQFFDVPRSSIKRDIVTVGRFEKQKNHKLLIRAFAQVANEIKNDNLILYGEGTLREDLEQLIQKLGLCDRVFLPGSITDVPNKLKDAKLFVLSSDYEGMPNALMEAMAVGVPVVSTDCPCRGPRSLITNENQGILVPCDNVNEMAEAIKKVLNDEKMLTTIENETKMRAMKFAPSVIFKQWDDYIKRV